MLKGLSINSSVLPLFPLQNHSMNSLAYDFGLLLRYKVYKDMAHKVTYLAEVEHHSLNFGKGGSGTLLSQTTNNRLQIRTFTTQGLVLSLQTHFG
jgi:hypothetical protein